MSVLAWLEKGAPIPYFNTLYCSQNKPKCFCGLKKRILQINAYCIGFCKRSWPLYRITKFFLLRDILEARQCQENFAIFASLL